MEFLKARGHFLLFIIEGLLTLAGTLYLTNTLVFINTRQVATAVVVRVEVTKSPQPYKATMVYLNKFVNDNVVSYVDNIGSNYAKKHIDVNNHLQIYYRNYFPREIYLVDYKYPTYTNAGFAAAFSLILGTLTFLQFKRRHTRIEKF